MDKFTIEETQLVCIYDTSSKQKLISELRFSLPHVYEPELADMMRSVIDKLENMTDEEYADIGFYAADDNFEED